MKNAARDLSRASGTYTEALEKSLKAINEAYARGDSLESLKQAVADAVGEAHDTPAKRKFLTGVMGQRTREGVIAIASNAWLRGSGCGARLDDRFAR